MPTRRSDRGRMLAKQMRENPEQLGTILSVMDPTPISDVKAIADEPTNWFNYLAAVPFLGNAAKFAKAIKRSNIDDLPADQRWRFDEDATPDEMRKVFAEEYITDLELNDLKGQDLIDEVGQLRQVDEDLYNAVGENLPDYMRNVDLTPPTDLQVKDAQGLIQELMGADATTLERAYKDLADNDPKILKLVQDALGPL